MDALDHRNRQAPIYFVDPRVPMATVGQVILHRATGSFGLALRGPRGLAVLAYATRLCAPVPSVELDVHAASFVLRTSTGRGGCTGGPDDAQVTTVTFARTGVDRGLGALRRALAAAPWSLTAQRATDAAPRREDVAVQANEDAGTTSPRSTRATVLAGTSGADAPTCAARWGAGGCWGCDGRGRSAGRVRRLRSVGGGEACGGNLTSSWVRPHTSRWGRSPSAST
jgi:hypothetical protein